MDVKIKVNPGKSDFKTRPMLLVNTVNFYAHENWALMANAGCRMIEEIMIEALRRFPTIDQLREYPENYQREKGIEGKKHVELHERLGVWNVIERFGRNEYSETMSLTNPRTLNSWADAYDDRDPEVIRQEEKRHLQNEIDKVNRQLTEKKRDLRALEERQQFAKNPGLWQILGITEKEVKELPVKIHTLGDEITRLGMKLDQLETALNPVEEQVLEEDNDVDGDDELMKRLALLNN
jgi:hypothetical protein